MMVEAATRSMVGKNDEGAVFGSHLGCVTGKG